MKQIRLKAYFQGVEDKLPDKEEKLEDKLEDKQFVNNQETLKNSEKLLVDYFEMLRCFIGFEL